MCHAHPRHGREKVYNVRMGEERYNRLLGLLRDKQFRDRHKTWIDKQAAAKRAASAERAAKARLLEAEQQRQLQGVDERFSELTKYKAKHGHCNVPSTQGPLGGWVDKQRMERNKGNLSADRV